MSRRVDTERRNGPVGGRTSRSAPATCRALAGIFVLLLAAGCGEQAAAPTSPSAHSWERTAIDGGERVARVLRVESRWIALIGSFPGSSSVLQSADGRSWEVIYEFGEDERVVDLVASGDGFVAVGNAGELTASIGDAMAWVSQDLRSWEAIPVADDAALQLTSVAVDLEGTLVTVGTELSASGQRPRAFASPDGRTWTAGGELEGGENGSVSDVVAGGPGFVVVGVGPARGNEPQHAAAWTSTDGLTWNPADDAESFAGAAFSAVLVTDDGLVAVGQRFFGAYIAPTAWRSPDGTVWSALGDVRPGLATPPPQSLSWTGGMYTDVAAVSDGTLVAVGTEWAEIDAQSAGFNAMVALSTDGEVWDRVVDPQTFFGGRGASPLYGAMSVASAGGTILVGGASEDGATIWIGE